MCLSMACNCVVSSVFVYMCCVTLGQANFTGFLCFLMYTYIYLSSIHIHTYMCRVSVDACTYVVGCNHDWNASNSVHPPPPSSPGYKYPEVSEVEMSAGDAVMVQADPDVFKVAQDGHGGWNDRMAEVSYGVAAVVATNPQIPNKVIVPLLYIFHASKAYRLHAW